MTIVPAFLRRPTVAVATIMALAFTIAYAGSTLQIDASGVDFASQVGTAGIELAWDDGLVLTLTAADTTSVGNLVLPSYDAGELPTDALGRIMTAEAVTRLDFLNGYADGASFVHQGTSVETVMRQFADRLVELGLEVAREAGASALSVHHAGQELRAVFGATEGGVTVYLGR